MNTDKKEATLPIRIDPCYPWSISSYSNPNRDRKPSHINMLSERTAS